MAVVRTWAAGDESLLQSTEPALVTAATRAVILHALIASRAPAETGVPGAGVDPVDRAVYVAAARLDLNRSRATGGAPQIDWIPFSSERKFMAVFLRSDDAVTAYLKGAPTRVLDLCSLDTATRTTLRRVNDALASDGLRVLGVASGPVAGPVESSLSGLTFDGFIGLADPPAPGVKDTIALLHAAGLRTVMLTGDQRLTAQSVGRELGLLQGDVRVVEGRELEGLSKEDLQALAAHAAVFSRITPEHKLRIVEALQARGEIVAMLGDGVNDAPALRKADVGVAMGTRGTDAAKQAAAIVLRDDRFETIAAAVEEWRVVFDNIRAVSVQLQRRGSARAAGRRRGRPAASSVAAATAVAEHDYRHVSRPRAGDGAGGVECDDTSAAPSRRSAPVEAVPAANSDVRVAHHGGDGGRIPVGPRISSHAGDDDRLHDAGTRADPAPRQRAASQAGPERASRGLESVCRRRGSAVSRTPDLGAVHRSPAAPAARHASRYPGMGGCRLRCGAAPPSSVRR
jgi:phosphoglycolate phosphatase-like HAD superfamily hydrolase